MRPWTWRCWSGRVGRVFEAHRPGQRPTAASGGPRRLGPPHRKAMTREELFDAWAPAGASWSDWAKPVLFAHWPRPLPAVADVPPPDLSWVPPAADRVALVVDLPGAASVHLGLALAAAGYRPVPLF